MKHNGFEFVVEGDEINLKMKCSNIEFAFENKDDNFDENGNLKYIISDKDKFYQSFMKTFLHKRSNHSDYEDLLTFCDDVFDKMIEDCIDGIKEV